MLLPMLDVAIGLIFIYSLIAVICSAVNEAIEAWLKVRATNLADGLRQMLNDEDLLKRLYAHPLISSLTPLTPPVLQSQIATTPKLGVIPTPTQLPSYIPSENFARALIDLLKTEMPAPQSIAAAAAAGAPAADFPAAIAAAPLPEAPRVTLSALALPMQTDLAQLQGAIELWFNNTMDRVSGWYKRRTQAFILGLGFAIALVLNIDTVALVKTLAQNDEARSALAQAALDHSAAQTATASAIKPADNADVLKDALEASKRARAETANLIAKLEQSRLPIGWSSADELGDFLSCVNKLLGLLLTTFAISLGADFWFGILNKFVSIRSSLKPDDKPRP